RKKFMRVGMPTVKSADYRNFPGVRRPYGKINPCSTGNFNGVRTEFIVEFIMASFAKKINIVVRKQGVRNNIFHSFSIFAGIKRRFGEVWLCSSNIFKFKR